MAASSVTGVGQGAATESGQKGSENMYLGVEKLIGPRIVHAGTGTTSSNVLTITLPETLPGVTADYIVLVMNVSSTASSQGIHVTSITASGGQMTGFAVYSDEAANVFHWAVIRVSNATVTVG